MTPVRLACVLRSGGEYKAEHVRALREGLLRYWPTDGPPLRLLCLTDVPLRQYGVEEIPLVGGWPKWWAKMELMRPDIHGDLLYLDLDTVIVGSIGALLAVRRLTVLRDFYHRGVPARRHFIGSGLMYLPEAARPAVWQRWLASPEAHMRRHAIGGDQKFLETCWPIDQRAYWQDVLPGATVSYKVHVRSTGKVPKDAKVVCFHGKPRPWMVPPLVPAQVRI